MPKSKREPTKKHGDTMEPLIEETGGDTSRGQRDESANQDPEQIRNQSDE